MMEISQSIDIKGGRYDMTGFALSFFCGIVAGSVLLPGRVVVLGSLLLSALVVFLNRKNSRNFKAALLLAVFMAGMLDYSLASGMAGKLAAFEGKNAVFECLILDDPAVRGGYLQYTARSLSLTLEQKRYNYSEKVFLRIKGDKAFKFGDKVTVEGQCAGITGRRNPGDFDYRLYYRSKGIFRTIEADSAVLSEENCAGAFRTLLYLSRNKVRSVINRALPSDEAAVLVGIITGDKSDIDEDTREAYMRAGLSHMLSVSGLHVSFLMLLLTYVLTPFKLEKRLKGFITLSAITYYVLLIGAPLPSVRALIMLGVLMAGKLLGRDYDLLASVSFAAFAILAFNPFAVYDPGFMISFGAMYSIAFLYPVFFSMLRRVPSPVSSASALSLSVFFGLAPILAYYFNYISVVSIIVNILAVPLALIITVAGFAGVIAGIVSGTLAVYILSVDYYLIKLLGFIIGKAAGLPLAGFYIPALPFYFYVLYYVGIGLLTGFYRSAYLRVYMRRLSLAYMLVSVVAFSVYCLPAGEMRMVFFDVGQGDSCCIITPLKKAVLIDGGGSSGRGDYYYDVGGKITVPAMLHQGVWRIDTVIVSHLHDDHMEGLLKVMEVYPVKNIILPKVSAGPGDVSPNAGPLTELCRRKGIKIYKLGKGDRISLERGIRLDFLLPGEEASSDENENSLVGMLAYGDFHALFTGDIGKKSEILLTGPAVRSSLLKVPHHGSGGSSSEGFLRAVRPKVGIISVGRNNFGHPSADTLERLRHSGTLAYRTDENGAVIVTTDGKSINIKTVK